MMTKMIPAGEVPTPFGVSVPVFRPSPPCQAMSMPWRSISTVL